MGRFCCVKSCKAFWTPVTHLSFFAFPFNNEEMKEKWLKAAPGYKNLSKNSTICSSHFLPDDYTTFTGKRILKKTAVPSIFGDIDTDPASDNNDEEECSFPPPTTADMKPSMIILYKPNNIYNTAVQISAENFRDLRKEEEMAKRTSEVSVQTCTRLSGPSEREKELQYKLRIFQSRLRRKEKMVTSLKTLVAEMKKREQSAESLEEKFLKKFTKFDLELFKNVASNNNIAKNRQTYSPEMKKFAITLYSCSPRAYKFVRTKINLPHNATIRKWVAHAANDLKVTENIDEAAVQSIEIEEENMVSDSPIEIEEENIVSDSLIEIEEENMVSDSPIDASNDAECDVKPHLVEYVKVEDEIDMVSDDAVDDASDVDCDAQSLVSEDIEVEHPIDDENEIILQYKLV